MHHINELLTEYTDRIHNFETLLDQTIDLQEGELVFKSGNIVSNLAGIVGSKSACNKNTKSVIGVCYFNPRQSLENLSNTILNQMLLINLKEELISIAMITY